MDQLKLLALDDEDLKVVSAHAQDAVLRVADLDFLPARKCFVAGINRFVWERKGGLFGPPSERRRAALRFERVLSARFSGFSREQKDQVLSLLAIRFIAGEAPAGTIELVFSGGAAIALKVECIEVELADLGAAWRARGRPRHAV